MDTSTMARFDYYEMQVRNNKIRRTKELRRHIIILVLSVVLFITLAVLFFSSKSFAADKNEEELYKYYRSYQIQPGDSLYGISEEFSVQNYMDNDDFVNEVMFINNITEGELLVAGNFIIVPYYDVLRSYRLRMILMRKTKLPM